MLSTCVPYAITSKLVPLVGLLKIYRVGIQRLGEQDFPQLESSQGRLRGRRSDEDHHPLFLSMWAIWTKENQETFGPASSPGQLWIGTGC